MHDILREQITCAFLSTNVKMVTEVFQRYLGVEVKLIFNKQTYN